MTTAPTPSSTFALAKRLFAYNPALFGVNLLLWGAVHASPALVTLAVGLVGLYAWRARRPASPAPTSGQEAE